jgi:hypothetical protein
MSNSEHDYLMRRATEERTAAERAGNLHAQNAHLELAHRYEVAAAAAIGQPVVQLKANRQTGSRRPR